MEVLFMDTKNNKTTNEPNRFRLYFADKLNLKNNKTIALANLSIYYTWQNVKSLVDNNKFKITARPWDETFNLPDSSYSISYIQDYFEFIIKKHETITTDENYPVLIYPNKIRNRIVFKIKPGYKLELTSNETIYLLCDGPIIDKNKNDDNLPEKEQVHSVLVHCNVVQSNYQQDSKLLYTFVPDKQFGQLLVIEPKALIVLKPIDSVFTCIEIWFTDQDNRLLQIEDNVNITLIVSTENT